MFGRARGVLIVFVFAGFYAAGIRARPAFAAGQAGNPDNQTVTPQAPKVAAGEVEARKLLLLMDTDKNGKVSRQEFMNFMAAEFDRLDKNKDGQLDVKELTKSQLVAAPHTGGHR